VREPRVQRPLDGSGAGVRAPAAPRGTQHLLPRAAPDLGPLAPRGASVLGFAMGASLGAARVSPLGIPSRNARAPRVVPAYARPGGPSRPAPPRVPSDQSGSMRAVRRQRPPGIEERYAEA